MKNNRLIILPLLVALVSTFAAIGSAPDIFTPRPYTRRPFTSSSQYRNLNMGLLKSAEAGDVPGVQAVLSKGADLNYQDAATGDTAAHKAARAGHAAVLQVLNAARPCVNLSIRNNNNQTPAEVAAGGEARLAASVSRYMQDVCERWETENPPR